MNTSSSPCSGFLTRLLLAAALLCCTLTATAQVVNIPDARLELELRQALDKPTGDITVEDMESLIELDASCDYSCDDIIKSLDGLEFAKNLSILSLSGGSDGYSNDDPLLVLDDFTPLAGLSSLTTLNLGLNQLTNLSLPTDLNSLTNLDLGGQQLTSLTELCVYNNQLASLSLPPDLISLTRLFLRNNQLTSLSLPPGLTSLTILDLQNNPLTEIILPAGIQGVVPTLLDLGNSGVQVTLLPVLKSPRKLANGDFEFRLLADEETFTIFRSTDATDPTAWIEVGTVTITTPNWPGETFTDTTTRGLDKAFYEAGIRGVESKTREKERVPPCWLILFPGDIKNIDRCLHSPNRADYHPIPRGNYGSLSMPPKPTP